MGILDKNNRLNGLFSTQIQMQADPTQAGMWKSVVTQDGQMGVTVPAPPPYSPPQGPWYTAPMVTVRITHTHTHTHTHRDTHTVSCPPFSLSLSLSLSLCLESYCDQHCQNSETKCTFKFVKVSSSPVSIFQVVLPQALTGPSEVYYNMSESWDKYLVRTRNKWTIGEFPGLLQF